MICSKVQLCADSELSGALFSGCDNNNRAKCIESSDKRSAVKCEENRKRYILENTMRSHVISYKVDDGIVVADKMVPEGINKCDYLYIVDSEGLVAVLIELKGVDVPKALRQINGTLMLFKEFFGRFAHIYGRIIVTSSTPDLKASPEYVKLVKRIRQTYKGNIKIVKQQFSEKDTELHKE